MTVPTQQPRPVADCHEPVCPCPSAVCTISRMADEGRGPQGRSLAALALLNQAASAVRAQLERSVLSDDRLSWTAWQVLLTVDAWGSIEPRNIASQISVSKATLTGLLHTLDDRGLLARKDFPADARRVLLVLTPAGRDLVARLFPAVADAEADLVGDLTEIEMSALCDATRALLRRVASGSATST